MRNHFNLVRLLGLFTLGIGCMLSILFGAILKQQLDYGHTRDLDYIGTFFVFGILHFIIGICLLLKLPWTRKVTIGLYICSLIYGTIFLLTFVLPQSYGEDYYIALAFSIPPYVTYLCGIIYLRMPQVRAAYYEEDTDYSRKDDILDQF